MLRYNFFKPKKNKKYSEIPNYILSFPRSGNHWVRYVIEWFSMRPTVGEVDGINADDDFNTVDKPICMRADMPHVQVSAPPVAIKRHSIREFDSRKFNLLFLVRDYKECVVRHLELGGSGLQVVDGDSGDVEKLLDRYFDLLKIYSSWNAPKFMVHYEDLIASPERSLRGVVDFFGIAIDDASWVEFFENYQWHKANSLGALIDPSGTQGTVAEHHKKNLSNSSRLRWDAYVRGLGAPIYDCYLKRYQE